MNDGSSAHKSALADLAEEAWQLGRQMDLSGCHYGPATWSETLTITRPSPYYYFLAGFAARTGARSVVEVGTHFGGSALAIAKGIQHVGAEPWKIVTVDVSDLNRDGLSSVSQIVKVVGSAASPAVQEAMVAALGVAKVNLLYIDALKSRTFVTGVLKGFACRASLDWIILDDIAIHPSMRELWSDIEQSFGERCLDVSKIQPAVRDPKVGFGLIHCDANGADRISALE